jgi:hypothetical protein
MDSEIIFHNWLLNYLKEKLAKDYSDIAINPEGDKKHPFQGCYPDMILNSHGLTVGIVEVETENSLTEDKAKTWKTLSQLNVKLMLIVPERLKMKVASLLWDYGIAQKVSIGGYEIKITMP